MHDPKIPATSTTGGKPAETLKAGDALEVTAAQLAVITTAGGTTRSVVGTTGTRDQLGESYAASNATP